MFDMMFSSLFRRNSNAPVDFGFFTTTKPSVLMNAMLMSWNAVWRSASLKQVPVVNNTPGRVERGSAEGELGLRVRILMSYLKSLLSSGLCENVAW